MREITTRKKTWILLTVATATLLLWALLLSAPGWATAQADDPPPIAVELLTGRAPFTDAVDFDLNIGLRDGEPIQMSVSSPTHTVVARITVQPGAQFPWHTHPGPVFVNVAEGELVYVPASDCIGRAYPAPNAFVDPGRGYTHTAYNPTDGVTVLIATFFEVPAEGPLTITEGIEIPTECNVEVGQHDH